jgi:LDH2 family malate/lactate/ureidoglycolate dehydrogenase
LVDADGRPTDDPEALAHGGALRTFGGHKGFALATIAELLGGALTGAEEYRDEGPGGESFRSAGLMLLVISADAFGSADGTRSAASALQEAIRAVPPADGYEAVLAPGDPESRNRRTAGDYVTLPSSVWSDIESLLASADDPQGEM